MDNINNTKLVKNKNKKIIFKIIIIIFLIPIIIQIIKSSFIGMTTCGEVSDGEICSTCRCIGFLKLELYVPPSSKCIGIDLGCK